MKKSWINRVMTLLVGTLISSILFLGVITVTYNSFYRQNVLGVNNGIAANWASSIDSRLNTIYEHVYDITSAVFKKTEVRPDSLAMNYTVQTELQNSLDSKVWTSSDVTMFFIMDCESDLFLSSVSRAISSGTNSAVKMFLREYAPTDADSVSNKEWTVVTINQRSYYYKGLSLGRYIIGAVAECSTFAPDAYGDSGNTAPTCFIKYDGEIFFGMGDKSVAEFIDFDKKGDYFKKGYAVSTSHLSDSDVGLIYITKPQGLKISLRIASMFLIVDSALCVVLIG